MRINRNKKSRNDRSDAAGSGIRNVITRSQVKQLPRRSPRNHNTARSDKPLKRNYSYSKINKTRAQNADCKKQSHPSSTSSARKKRCRSVSQVRAKSSKSSATGSGKQIQQPKRMDGSSIDEAVSIQKDSEASGASAEEAKKEQGKTSIVHSDDQDIIEDGSERGQLLSDFDVMRARKKAESTRRRKRNHSPITNENVELIVELLQQMKQAATQDRQLNLESKPATKKIAILHKVMQQLIKKDLQHTFLDYDLLHVLAEWIRPLPNKALPCLQIRESVLKLLTSFPAIDKLYLKQSGIGKAVMYLYKHPKETKANRKRANVLITGWFRSIFNISTDFSGMSREERRQRDLKQLPHQQKPVTPDVVPPRATVEADFWLFKTNHNTTIRPGEKGWIQRARVPLPSEKVYIVRPQSKIDVNISSVPKKQPNRYEMYLKRFKNNKRKNTARPPVHLSIAGTKLCD